MIPMTLTEQRLASAHEQIARMRHYLELIREQTGEWRDWPDLENSDIKQAAPFHAELVCQTRETSRVDLFQNLRVNCINAMN